MGNFYLFNFTMVNFDYLIIYHGHFHTYFFTLNFFYLLTWDKPAVCSVEGGNVRNIWFNHIPLVSLFTLVYMNLLTLLLSHYLDVPCYLTNRQRFCSVWTERKGFFTTIVMNQNISIALL